MYSAFRFDNNINEYFQIINEELERCFNCSDIRIPVSYFPKTKFTEKDMEYDPELINNIIHLYTKEGWDISLEWVTHPASEDPNEKKALVLIFKKRDYLKELNNGIEVKEIW